MGDFLHMKAKRLRSSLMLALTSLIWGAAFVAQSVGMDYVGPFTFNAARFIVGGLVLFPCIFFLRRVNGDENRQMDEEMKKARTKTGVAGGICCGIFLCFASMLQQIGVSYTSVGKAGFITSLYIIIVPILGIFIKKKVPFNIWVSVAIAVVGMYLSLIHI